MFHLCQADQRGFFLRPKWHFEWDTFHIPPIYDHHISCFFPSMILPRDILLHSTPLCQAIWWLFSVTTRSRHLWMLPGISMIKLKAQKKLIPQHKKTTPYLSVTRHPSTETHTLHAHRLSKALNFRCWYVWHCELTNQGTELNIKTEILDWPQKVLYSTQRERILAFSCFQWFKYK